MSARVSPTHDDESVIVIGGGFFGCAIARHIRPLFREVHLLERDEDLLLRASYANQARVHHGYHYPRSILTALRSRVNFSRFLEDYPECIDRSFHKYYAIARHASKVTAHQYRLFCERIGAPAAPAPAAIRRLFNPDLIEDVFAVEECAFDATKLRSHLRQAMDECGVHVHLRTRVRRVQPAPHDRVAVVADAPGGPAEFTGNHVFNCTYSELNHVLVQSNQPVIPLKHEFTEMALIEPPEELAHLGVTVMCGPYFSTMPFPPRNAHTLSHVRYTPHFAWADDDATFESAYERFERTPKRSAFAHMIRDAQRYIPTLAKARQLDSIWEVKTVLPLSEIDDSRPILFRKDHGMPNFHCILGGKIDNIYDGLHEIDALLAAQTSAPCH